MTADGFLGYYRRFVSTAPTHAYIRHISDPDGQPAEPKIPFGFQPEGEPLRSAPKPSFGFCAPEVKQ